MSAHHSQCWHRLLSSPRLLRSGRGLFLVLCLMPQLLTLFSRQRSPYTKPQLRERLKSQVLRSGANPGKWDARKAQRLAQLYKRAGGGYRKGSLHQRQRSLQKWTKEDWTTSDGRPAQRKGYTTRYLPRAAWRSLSPGQIRSTNRKKIAASRQGKQFVRNTHAARSAGKRARQ